MPIARLVGSGGDPHDVNKHRELLTGPAEITDYPVRPVSIATADFSVYYDVTTITELPRSITVINDGSGTKMYFTFEQTEPDATNKMIPLADDTVMTFDVVRLNMKKIYFYQASGDTKTASVGVGV